MKPGPPAPLPRRRPSPRRDHRRAARTVDPASTSSPGHRGRRTLPRRQDRSFRRRSGLRSPPKGQRRSLGPAVKTVVRTRPATRGGPRAGVKPSRGRGRPRRGSDRPRRRRSEGAAERPEDEEVVERVPVDVPTRGHASDDVGPWYLGPAMRNAVAMVARSAVGIVAGRPCSPERGTTTLRSREPFRDGEGGHRPDRRRSRRPPPRRPPRMSRELLGERDAPGTQEPMRISSGGAATRGDEIAPKDDERGPPVHDLLSRGTSTHLFSPEATA